VEKAQNEIVMIAKNLAACNEISINNGSEKGEQLVE
jgi:flagellar motor switch protein FliG